MVLCSEEWEREGILSVANVALKQDIMVTKYVWLAYEVDDYCNRGFQNVQ